MLDFPVDGPDRKNFQACLAQKTNHSFKYHNVQTVPLDSARFGLTSAFITSRKVEKGEQVKF